MAIGRIGAVGGSAGAAGGDTNQSASATVGPRRRQPTATPPRRAPVTRRPTSSRLAGMPRRRQRQRERRQLRLQLLVRGRRQRRPATSTRQQRRLGSAGGEKTPPATRWASQVASGGPEWGRGGDAEESATSVGEQQRSGGGAGSTAGAGGGAGGARHVREHEHRRSRWHVRQHRCSNSGSPERRRVVPEPGGCDHDARRRQHRRGRRRRRRFVERDVERRQRAATRTRSVAATSARPACQRPAEHNTGGAPSPTPARRGNTQRQRRLGERWLGEWWRGDRDRRHLDQHRDPDQHGDGEPDEHADDDGGPPEPDPDSPSAAHRRD